MYSQEKTKIYSLIKFKEENVLVQGTELAKLSRFIPQPSLHCEQRLLPFPSKINYIIFKITFHI